MSDNRTLIAVILLLIAGLVTLFALYVRPYMNTQSETAADTSEEDPWEGQAIFHAIEARDLKEVKRLVESGQDLEARGFGDMTPVNVSAAAGTWDIMLYLLEKGADPTAVDDQKFSAVDGFLRSRAGAELSEEEGLAKPAVEAWLRDHKYIP